MEKDYSTSLVMATFMEAEPFIKGLSLSKIEKKPFEIFSNDNIILIISGIGKSNAAIAASYLIWKYGTRCMFNVGASGATKNNRELGDIFHINKVVEYDRPRLLNGGIRIKKPDLLKGFENTSLATQDRVILSSNEREEISKHAGLVDMEGASFLQACRLFSAKSYLFKIVSDTPLHNKKWEIRKNIKRVRELLFVFFQEKILDNDKIQKSLIK